MCLVSKGATLTNPPATERSERQRRFEAVYAAHHGSVLGYVLRRIDNADDAADVIGEIFLTVWRRLDDMPGGEQARLWLYGVARRVLGNHRRGERRRSALTERLRTEQLRADLAAAYRPPEFTGELARIAAAFRRLTEAERELLSLSAWEELDNGQIAAVLGCSRNAVRIRMFRARKRFAAELTRVSAQPTRPAEHARYGDLA
jgi:RNA polymerase sigma factor (sigma-70 family)